MLLPLHIRICRQKLCIRQYHVTVEILLSDVAVYEELAEMFRSHCY